MLPTILKGFSGRALAALLNLVSTHSTREFERFTSAAIPGVPTRADQSPAVVNVEPLGPAALAGATGASDPARCEELFTGLIRAGNFDTAWELLTPDSQASWQGRESFRREMQARQPGRGLVGSRVREVRMLAVWTDDATKKTYRQVAELVVDYHIRQRSREMVVTRPVHLVNVSGGWKSLCYRS
jgi:hypothetical protein